MSANVNITNSLVMNDATTTPPTNVTSVPPAFATTATNGLNNQGQYLVPTTSGGVVIPLGGITTPGYVQFVNTDPTNYVQLLTAVSGTPFAKLLPNGGVATFFYDPTITAPAWIAHTAACRVNFTILNGA